MADHVPFGKRVEARVARSNITRMAEQFILGETAAEAVDGAARLWASGIATTVDLLGEKPIVAAEADRYADRVVEMVDALADAAPDWTDQPLLERDDRRRADPPAVDLPGRGSGHGPVRRQRRHRRRVGGPGTRRV